jgi:riboflavin biosynthesis protein ribF
MAILTRKDATKRRIASVGMMDGVHAGHCFLLDFLRAQGDQLNLSAAVVTFEDHPLMTVAPDRAPQLLTTPEQKLDMLSKSVVDDVIVLNFNHRMSRMSASKFLEMLHDRWGIDALVVGFNNRFGRDRKEGIDAYQAIGEKIGMKIIEAPEMTAENGQPLSSSAIRQCIQQGNMEQAAVMLTHPYTMIGKVVHGQALGRKIGFPTANIDPETPRQLVPKSGVYAAWVVTPDGRKNAAMVNIGVRPTVSGEGSEPTIEAHIIDYTGYLYDENVSVEFVARLRDEKKFKNMDSLVKQLHKDENKVRKMLL